MEYKYNDTNGLFNDYDNLIIHPTANTDMPAASNFAGKIAFISYSGTPLIRYSDGANWVSILGTGEANTASNVKNTTGSIAKGVWKRKDLINLEFKSLIGLGSVVVDTYGDNEISITSTGEENAAENIGDGAPLYAGKSGDNLQFKSIVNGDGILLEQFTDEIKLSLIHDYLDLGDITAIPFDYDNRTAYFAGNGNTPIGLAGSVNGAVEYSLTAVASGGQLDIDIPSGAYCDTSRITIQNGKSRMIKIISWGVNRDFYTYSNEMNII